MEKILTVILGIILAVALMAIAGWVVSALWQVVMVLAFGLPQITWLQGLALLALVYLLFPPISGGRSN